MYHNGYNITVAMSCACHEVSQEIQLGPANMCLKRREESISSGTLTDPESVLLSIYGHSLELDEGSSLYWEEGDLTHVSPMKGLV